MPSNLTRFIPYAASDIAGMCLHNSPFNHTERKLFLRVFHLLKRQFGLEALASLEQLKHAYRSRDPDSDLRRPNIHPLQDYSEDIESLLVALLNRANYDPVSEQTVQDSLGDSSLFRVALKVDFNQYEEVLLFKRGVSQRSEQVPSWFGLRSTEVEFINFDRVLIYIRLRPTAEHQAPKILLRLFQNVPRSDLEMLFPDTQVGLRFVDKLMIGVPALVSGVVVVSTKLGASLFLLGSLLAFYLGLRAEPVILDKTALIAIGAGFAALGGYILKQLSNFKNRKLKFTQALTSNLYFKLLDNNAGVFHRIADSAMEEELKEAILAYFFLIQSPSGISATQLDKNVQQWFHDQWQYQLDFEVDDALKKLRRLNLARIQSNGTWRATPLQEAVETLKAEENS